jgi:hypothetical protein
MAQHAALTLKTKIDVYFAHTHFHGSEEPTRTPTDSSVNIFQKG